MTRPESSSPAHPQHTIPGLRAHKVRNGAAPLVMVTAYDAPTARLAAEAGVDILLVGDSVGTARLGYASTVPVTLADILHHCRAVRRGAPAVHIVADLPFMTYGVSDEQAVANAGRLLQDGGADAVKLEGGTHLASRISAIVLAGIPVVGHIGLTPQTAGGNREQELSIPRLVRCREDVSLEMRALASPGRCGSRCGIGPRAWMSS